MSEPSETAVKTLFALSRNVCFYEGCEQKLTDQRWRRVKARIAHIKGDKPGSQRYDAEQPESERQGFDNLMLLCPNCHTRIDELEPDEHPVERLVAMKERHLEHHAFEPWASEEQLVRYTVMAVVEYRAAQSQAARWVGSPGTLELSSAEVHRRADEAWATLVRVERDRASGAIEVFNDSPESLLEPVLTTVSGAWRGDELAGLTPGRVEPGVPWRAGFLPDDHAAVTRPPYRVELVWTDQSGGRRRAQYDL